MAISFGFFLAKPQKMFLNIFSMGFDCKASKPGTTPGKPEVSMTTLPFKLAIDPKPMQFLLTVEGTPQASDRNTVRETHNMAMLCVSRTVLRSLAAGEPSTVSRNCIGLGSIASLKGRVVIETSGLPGVVPGFEALQSKPIEKMFKNIFWGFARKKPKEIAMPYTPAHKQTTRTRIVQAARRLFNLRGFADVSIAEIMGEAGLTHGGFYKHFARKEELYQEASW